MPFKYIRDPLFLFCVVSYLANRLILKPHFAWAFLHSHLNDVICIPFWVPLLLYLMRRCRLRPNDEPPGPHEIIVPLVLWSVVFEIWLPFTSLFRGLSHADHLDVLSYTCGALGAAVFWRWHYCPRGAASC